MDYKEREKIINKAYERRARLLENKGKEYSQGNNDINYNFREVVRRLGTAKAGTPFYSCGVYMEKAILSMEAWFQGKELSSGESLISRLDDIRNYIDILESLFYEEEKEK